ncbi:DUF2937 family protein [Stutzerimonas xanthomarina]|uniref:DUF2937 domain-containing protein n=2 Tax=Stutzerimonas xanthomarina TaxID=271420 RepID=A0A1M5NWB7_9GAMM|nr:DUF2937 family protein [Stutzerimonas xanthomarina]MCP9338716.1 DUF2937 family protein [Stutzerimonas xanthomarina]SEH80075.1 Protein of unknown function [Stutzerimonas xanthomarina]SHG93802.1 Protein of unknown function [Stutzerimonas xanthomarina DSM 18231]
MLRSYLRLTLFALGLLVGVQVPGFIEAYGNQVEARRLEAQQGLLGFQDTAGRFFNGDLNALVEHYRVSEDPVIQSDARSVSALVERARLLDRERRVMEGPWYAQAWHVLIGADQAIRRQVWNSYRFQVLLSPEAIAWGLSCALLLAWIVESLFVLLRQALFPQRNRRRRRTANSLPSKR